MERFQINFQLQELERVMPFGGAPDLRLHWFGLTDGLLWIDAGTQTIYEYSEAARKYFQTEIRYNDYQISRFLEDFFFTFRHVGEPVPEELYDVLEQFDQMVEKWRERHEDEPDEVYERFYFDEYCLLGEWRTDRSFDSGHLVGGPYIGCFRCGDKLKLLWKSGFRLEDGSSIWTAPEGCFEMPYGQFVSEVKRFLDAFFAAMDRQVEQAAEKNWGNIFLDKQRLVEEHREREEGFLQDLTFLEAPRVKTDWDKVMALYTRMKEETK